MSTAERRFKGVEDRLAYLGVSSNKGVNSSSFRISSDALNAKVQLDTTGVNFRYDLGEGNVNFGSLTYGGGSGIEVGNGVYDDATLTSITGSSAFFGSGTITVVPEPMALLGGAAASLRRRTQQVWKPR